MGTPSPSRGSASWIGRAGSGVRRVWKDTGAPGGWRTVADWRPGGEAELRREGEGACGGRQAQGPPMPGTATGPTSRRTRARVDDHAHRVAGAAGEARKERSGGVAANRGPPGGRNGTRSVRQEPQVAARTATESGRRGRQVEDASAARLGAGARRGASGGQKLGRGDVGYPWGSM